ncbi:ATPase involved in DNA repair (plasmid) [Variovorax sp. SRS16]|uniref:ATP-binding protein n=1 Tax=Variovorax sp. SRS16 TaxID=282217 RepID=UPI0013162061|nr:ATP-binding protein [Variovorax sp. SRS16]VTU45491.1 ATPase involved in DNA repair [Variovorax sp. SRS16]
MPHQLRRIIGVNLYNPKDDRPSGRIAIMDPRGGVLAVGVNGAGKTTFLRLLPLFYGATASQILRGTGRRSMIAYTLPDASSAVAFEYERESEDDLRTVVMHCRPNEDVPQFHIVTSGFREDFFYDENNQFVRREDFKARIEAMRHGPKNDQTIEVSPKLHLHQYRSVILNERLATKEAVELRRLAERHSLGPRRLVNLNQIAAAMANEKISFRDLQNIVIDQVSDLPTEGAVAANNRVLLKNRDDVTGLLDDCAHLAKIMKAEPTAQAMTAKADALKKHHYSLCSLHVAIKAAFGQVERELEELKDSESGVKAEYEASHRALVDQLAGANDALGTARSELRILAETVSTAEAQRANFDAKDAESLASEQDNEDRLASERQALQRELQPLEDAAGAVAATEIKRLAEVDRAHSDRVAQIDQRLIEATDEAAARSREIDEAKDAAGEAMEAPPRLAEIAAETLALHQQIGALDALVRRPVESEASRAELERTNDAMGAANDALATARAAVHAASQAQREAKDQVDQALGRVRSAEAEGVRLAETLAATERQASPVPGSLLEFLRKSDPAVWAGTAKIIAPELLDRTDLKPRLLEDLADQPGDQGVVAAGAIAIATGEVATPAWVDTAEIQAKLQALRAAIVANSEILAKARTEAARETKVRVVADTTVSQRQGDEALALAAHETAAANLRRAKNFAEAERGRVGSEAAATKRTVEERIRSLGNEDFMIRNAEEARREAVRREFQTQQRRVEEDLKSARKRLNQEKLGAGETRTRERARVADDVKRELEGLGVDPICRKALKDEIASLHERLTRIEANKHVVQAWRAFLRDVAPTMEEAQARHDAQVRRCEELARKVREIERFTSDLLNAFSHRIGDIGRARARHDEDHHRLSTMLAGPLKDYLDYVPKNLSVDWGIHELEPQVRKHLTAVEQVGGELSRERRQLRDVLTSRPGPIAHWVELAERDLPDPQILLEHQYTWEAALLLVAWFRPDEHGPYVSAINTVMDGFLSIASSFVRDLELFDRKVESFNKELQQALKGTEHFERFRNLSVTVRSKVKDFNAMVTLRKMRDVHDASFSSFRTSIGQNTTMPSDESIQLIRAFRDLLPADGVLRVNLNDQIRLECSLEENGKHQTITNEEEFKAVSSNGNTALITAMFLMGFVQMIRGKDSPVRLIWITDEVGRFDAANVEAFLQTLDAHRIDVVSASPSIDPAIARFFPRICMFESNGQIKTSLTNRAQEVDYVAA